MVKFGDKKIGKKWRFLTQNKAKLCKNLHHKNGF
jgi:hypothetical protein